MNSIEKNKINTGLIPLPKDERDFRLGSISRNIIKEELPQEDFVVAWPIKIKFQDSAREDFCTGMSSAAVTEDQEDEEMSGEYQFAKIKQIIGEYKSWGADLRSAVKSLVNYGSLPQSIADEYIKKTFGEQPKRDDMANWKNWDVSLDNIAFKNRKMSFFEVDGPFDSFDNIRGRMFQNLKDKNTVLCGVEWKPEWTNAKGGIIEKLTNTKGFGHAFKIYGQKIINGKIYLRAQLSNGANIGDAGTFYFSREVINDGVAKFGLFMVKDIERENVETMIQTGIKLEDNILKKMWKLIKFVFK